MKISVDSNRQEGNQSTKKNQARKQLIKKVNQNHKTQKQKRFTQHKHLWGHKRRYGVMVSNLDAESKDASFNFVELLLKTFCSVM